ncbi:MAG: oligosaccharide flippase family protein [Candidatus Gracilibacteria bacterium]|nr:oligosaccharide flippase family protein [Candidatus Gracilibacteria bacterium]
MNKKIATNTLAQIGAKFFTALISIFLIKILTNYLDLAGYGLYSKIYNYLGIFAFLADLGLYAISIREISKNKENSEKIVGNVLTLRTILGGFIILIALITALFLPGYNSQVALSAIFIVGIFTVFGLINSSIMSLMQANLKAEFSLISTVTGKIFNITAIIFIVYFLFPKDSFDNANIMPFLAIMGAGLLGNIVMTVLNYFYARKICNIKYRFDTEYIKYIFKISLPYGLALFLSMVYFKVDVILLSILEPTTQADISIALYSVPMKIIEVLMILSGFFLNSMLPVFTESFKNKNLKKLKSSVENAFYILFSLGYGILFCGILFRDRIIEFVARSEYLDRGLYQYTSSDAFLIALFAFFFYIISNLFIYILIGTDKQKKLLKINSIVTVFNIIGNILVIPKFSFIGAAVITVLSQILLLILAGFEIRKIIKLKINILYIIFTVFIGIGLSIFGSYLLTNFSFGNYLDVFIFGGFIFALYSLLCYINIGKSILKNR